MNTLSKYGLNIFLILVLLAGCDSGPDVNQRLANAEEHIKQQKYRKAIIELKNILRKEPKHIVARHLMGDVYLELGDGDLAEKEFLRFAEYGGENKEIFLRLPRAWLLQHKYQKILYKFPKNRKISNKELQAKISVLRGMSFLGLEKLKQAEEEFKYAIDTNDQNIDAKLGMAKIALKRNELKNARLFINAALNLSNKSSHAWNTLALIEIKEQDYNKAIGHFEKSLELHGSNIYSEEVFNLRLALINALFELNQLSKAKVHIDGLLKIYPNNAIVLYAAALYDYKNNKLDTSQEKLFQVINISPNYMPTYLFMGAIHYAKGSYEQANKALTRFVNHVPSHMQARKLLASTRMKLNQSGEALEVLKEVDLSKQDTELLVMLGQVAIASGDGAFAIKTLEQAVQTNPENNQIRKALASVYIKQGAYELAIKSLQALTESEQEKTTYVLIEAYLRSGQLDKARSTVEKILKTHPNDPKVLTSAGVIELISGNRYGAKKYLNNANKLSSGGFVPAQLYLAKIEMEDGRYNDAATIFDQILIRDPGNLMSFIGLAQIAERKGNIDEAKNWLVQAYNYNSDNKLPAVVLASYYLKTNLTNDAQSVLSSALKYHPNDSDLLNFQAESFLQNQQIKNAIKTYKRLVELNPGNSTQYIKLASSYSKDGQVELARKALKEAQRLDPKSYLVKRGLSAVELQSGNYEHALKIAQEIQKDKKTSAVGYILAGDIYLNKKMYQEAEGAYKVALSLNADRSATYKLYDVYHKTGKLVSGIKLFKQWVKDHPNDFVVMFDLANLYASNKKIDDAIDLYQTILKTNKNDVNALNNIALLFIKKDNSKALEYALRAHKLHSSNVFIQDTLGWVYLNRNELDKGMRYIKAAADKTKDLSVHYHLAYGYVILGKKEQAKAILHKILNANTRFVEYSDAKKLLSSL